MLYLRGTNKHHCRICTYCPNSRDCRWAVGMPSRGDENARMPVCADCTEYLCTLYVCSWGVCSVYLPQRRLDMISMQQAK